MVKCISNENYHEKLILGNSQFRAIIYGCVAHLAALEGKKDTPPLSPLHEAHLLIIRIPKATAEIRREKGINAYGAEPSEGAQ